MKLQILIFIIMLVGGITYAEYRKKAKLILSTPKPPVVTDSSSTPPPTQKIEQELKQEIEQELKQETPSPNVSTPLPIDENIISEPKMETPPVTPLSSVVDASPEPERVIEPTNQVNIPNPSEREMSRMRKKIFFPPNHSFTPDQKVAELDTIASIYRDILYDKFKDKNISYVSDKKVQLDTLIEDAKEYLTDPATFEKRSKYEYIKNTKEFLDFVYQLKEENNQRYLDKN